MRVVAAIALASAGVALLGLTACAGNSESKAIFTVEGMHCDSCSSAITRALETTDGVTSAWADHEAGVAEAVHRTSVVSDEALKNVIENLGYTVTGISSEPVG